MNRIPDTAIRSFFDTVAIGFLVADCNRQEQFAPPRLLLHCTSAAMRA